jgi:glycosyltransferase involved in cell wall biosynthesis
VAVVSCAAHRDGEEKVVTVKIVYIHQHFRTPAMVGGTRSYEFAKRLVEHGHEVHMITADADAVGVRRWGGWRTSNESGITVHWAPIPYRNEMGYAQRLRAFGHFARSAAVRASRLEQDLVFATSTPLTVAVPAIYAAARRRVPMVFEVRDLWPEVVIALGGLRSPIARHAAWTLEALAYRRSSHIIALSDSIASSIRTRFPDTAVTVVPNGCDLSLFADAERSGKQLRAETRWLGQRPLVLYAGTLGPANGVEYLVRAAAVLHETHPDVRIAVVGTGREEQHLRQLATRLGVLNRNLFMLGAVSKTEVVRYFGACDLSMAILVENPALQGDAGNKVFDALAAGRPVGINYRGAINDLLRESGAGIALPPGDPVGAARVIAGFLDDSAATGSARMAARSLAVTRFDRNDLFARFETVLLNAHRGVPVRVG